MKRILYTSLIIAGVIATLAGCKKEEVKAVLQPGTANTLTISKTTLVLDSANADNTTAIDVSWKKVDYGVAVAATYTLQIDSMGDDNFANAKNVPMADNQTKIFTVAELNQLAILLGLEPETVGQLKVRVATNVTGLNSAPQHVETVYSNTIILKITPFSTKPKPIFPVPDSLYIVGDATPGGWGNPVPVPAQRFTQIDYKTFGIIIPLTGGKQYLLLPENGSWSHKYAVPDNTAPDVKTGTHFFPDASDNILGPDVSGLYKIIVDFVKGTYSVTSVDPTTIPDHLYIVGDATPGGWNNPVPVPAQEFTKTSAYTFTLTIQLSGGKQYLLLPVNGSWGQKFSVQDNTVDGIKMGGPFKAGAPDNIPSPDENGTYRIDVNFLTNTYHLTKL